jgi:hypothetical protein
VLERTWSLVLMLALWTRYLGVLDEVWRLWVLVLEGVWK